MTGLSPVLYYAYKPDQLACADSRIGLRSINRILEKGNAVSRVLETTNTLLDDLDHDTFKSIEKDLEEYVSIMTENRYCKVEMNDNLPRGFINGSGQTISYNILSTGTRDIFALALRLSMAKYFLKPMVGPSGVSAGQILPH